MMIHAITMELVDSNLGYSPYIEITYEILAFKTTSMIRVEDNHLEVFIKETGIANPETRSQP